MAKLPFLLKISLLLGPLILMYLSGLTLWSNTNSTLQPAISHERCITGHQVTLQQETIVRKKCDPSSTIMTWWWPLTISTHHISFAARHVTKVVVPLLSENGWAAHKRNNLLVFRAPRVFQIPELDMPEKEMRIHWWVSQRSEKSARHLFPAVTK